MEKLLSKIDNIILFFIIYTIIFLVFFSTLNYTLPFVLALVFALLIKKPTEFLIKNFNIKNSIASLITTIVFFTFIILIFSYAITNITQEAILLGKNTQIYISKNSSNIYDSIDKLKKYYDNLDPYIVTAIEKNLSGFITKVSNIAVSITGKIVSSLIGFLATIPYLLMVILFTLLTTYFFTKDIVINRSKLLNIIPSNKSDKILNIYIEAKRMLGNYILSYLLIIGITFLETIIVFLVFKVKYVLILSIVCAIADILPILGIGTIYIPLAIFYFFFIKNYITAFGILISYIIISIIRQIIEPKIVSSSLGIHPVAVLAALFIGLKANGLSGVIFCVFLAVFYNIFKKVDLI
ncbi:sporulation integral membrane protein YtvI [Clostridium sp. PL3]|uniref:Sporulation integral membrane protein YtvI n=1 Tax=Clostridium thailandense TaxID=2794346 RepID=A0A949TUX7_9CLOT|nr:sporulation integral membrane protein YtvI [Clostridium thailandense]MBV7275787.1 sporulation integral membrane protein YtvI [Clostridium thailandense]